jgi:hypothetical protein
MRATWSPRRLPSRSLQRILQLLDGKEMTPDGGHRWGQFYIKQVFDRSNLDGRKSSAT